MTFEIACFVCGEFHDGRQPCHEPKAQARELWTMCEQLAQTIESLLDEDGIQTLHGQVKADEMLERFKAFKKRNHNPLKI